MQKRFGAHEALAGVDLEIRPGEFFCLVGPSGCGKTTLLRCVAGFTRPDAGEIVCDGERLDPLPPHQRNLGMVFQNYALFPHLSVRENVAYGLRARRLPSSIIKERVERALAMVHLAHRGRSFPGLLSGGEQQRVATARALAIEPRLLLMDEPLSNLDAKLRVEMREEIRRVQRALGITTLYVTHDQEEALALSDRIAVMNAGRLEQIGEPLQIYRSPATPFVAGFIGQTNFLPGVVESVSGGEARVRVGEVERPSVVRGEQRILPKTDAHTIIVPAGNLSPGQAVTVALRPERFSLADPGAPGVMPGRIEEIVFLGAITRLQIQTAAGLMMIELHGYAGEGLKPGAQVSLAIQTDAAAVFSVAQG